MQEYLYNLAAGKHRGIIHEIIKIPLFALSLLYGALVSLLICFYRIRPCRLNCKVISIGNITLGGTGKTSLVEYVARTLRQEGHKAAVLSRGYKHRVVSQVEMGDEPFMLSQKLCDIPLIVDADRIKGARRAINEYGVDTVVLDDGFQQWKLKKDLEIVTIDTTNPFGNKELLPRGILREPLSSLKRADIFVLTKTNLNPEISELKRFLSGINPGAQVFLSVHNPLGFYKVDKPEESIAQGTLKKESVTLFCGIGDPASFENLVRNLGINIGLTFRFRDHYNYTQADLVKIAKDSQEKGINTIITTEKDAARLANLQLKTYNLQLLVLRITIEIKDAEEFNRRLLRIYSG